MAVGKNPLKERLYILKAEREWESAKQSRWYFRMLKYEQQSNAMDSLVEFRAPTGQQADTGETKTRVFSGTQERETLLAGLARVENFPDEDGKMLHWPANGNRAAKMEFLDYMLPADRRELANAINEGQEITEDLRKNSDSPSLSA